MLRKILAFVAMLYAVAAFAAVDVNKATAADLDGIKGIGPGTSTRILSERKKGDFKDWNDFIERVKGVGEGNAAKFSAEGLTVGGAAFKPMAAASAANGKVDRKAEAKMKAAEAKAKKVADKKAKDEARMAKTTKADAAKPAASAAMLPAKAASAALPPASAAKK